MTVFLLPNFTCFPDLSFFFSYLRNMVTWLTFSFWFTSRSAGNSLFTAGVCFAFSSCTTTCQISVSCLTAKLQLFIASVVYDSSFHGSGKTQAADCVAPDFSNLPSPYKLPNAFFFFFFIKQPTQHTYPNIHSKEKTHIQGVTWAM